MRRNRIVGTVFFTALFLCVNGVTVFAGSADDYFKRAGQSYSESHYRKALYYYVKTEKAGMKDEKEKAVRYAIKVMRARKDAFDRLESAERALAKRPDDKILASDVATAHRLFARELMRKEFYPLIVVPHLKRSVDLLPEDSESRMDLADAYYASMQYARAIEQYEKTIALDANTLSAYRMAGDACVAIGDYDKAKKLYAELIKANGAAPQKYEASEIAKVEQVIKALPETYKDIDGLLKDERFDEAETLLRKRLSLNAGDYIALTELGRIYQDKGDRKAALRLFNDAIKIAPDYPLSHFFLGRLYFVTQQYEKAIDALNVFKFKMKLLPKMDDETKKMYIDCLGYLSEVYFTLKMYKEARKETEEVLRLDPKDQSAYYNMGVYYYMYEHSRPNAYKNFKKVVELDPDTEIAKSATYAIEFMRNNPDPRIAPDFSFINQEYRN